jgi:hypothetical protein
MTLLGGAAGAELVGYDPLRRTSFLPQKPCQKSWRSLCVPVDLHDFVDNIPVLIDGAPEIASFTIDGDHDLVETPGLPRPRRQSRLWYLSGFRSGNRSWRGRLKIGAATTSTPEIASRQHLICWTCTCPSTAASRVRLDGRRRAGGWLRRSASSMFRMLLATLLPMASVTSSSVAE